MTWKHHKTYGVRRILGIIQYYRDIWAKRSHVLAPLTSLVGECGRPKGSKKKATKFVWLPKHQAVFDKMKKIVSREVTLAYPNFSQPFVIYTDASDYQLGSVITQEGRPLAFYSRKLNTAQVNYTVNEKELLSIVETLKEFRGILLGHKLKVYTDHKNLKKLTPRPPLKGLCAGGYSWKNSAQKLFTSKGMIIQ